MIEPGANSIRLVGDDALIEDAYITGGTMVSNAVRAVQHLAQEIEHHHRRGLNGNTVQEPVGAAGALFAPGNRYEADPDYAGLNELTAHQLQRVIV